MRASNGCNSSNLGNPREAKGRLPGEDGQGDGARVSQRNSRCALRNGGELSGPTKGQGGTMQIVRAPVALLGAFFIAAGFVLGQYGQAKGIGAGIAFGLLYGAAGAVLIALSIKPNRRM